LEATSKPVATIPVGTDVHEAIGWCVIAARRAGMPEATCDRFIRQAVKAADDDGESQAWQVLLSWFALRHEDSKPVGRPLGATAARAAAGRGNAWLALVPGQS
jgi:hypothetical protein